jgi:hypothetical protein
MTGFEARFERLELKYLIDEHTASRVRRDIGPFCRPDSHNATLAGANDQGRHKGYGISSLYLDSPGLALFQAKERGDPERSKLRIRTYRGSSIAILELKRKVSDVISKTRAPVDRGQVEQIARGRLPAAANPEVDHFLNDFALASTSVGAQPTLHVRYDREAYSSDVDTYARVTFDRRIEVQRTSDWNLETSQDGWCSFDASRRPDQRDKTVVLELKCQSFIPWWVTNLIRSHALKRQSFSKYGIGIYLTGVRNGEFSLPRRSAGALL